jgi:hypothetical protein
MDLYTTLIIYFIFLVYQKSLAIYMESKFPTYEDIKKTTPFWQNVYKLRQFNAFISLSFILYIFSNFKVNHYTFVVLCILLTSVVNFFLFNSHYIYYIIEKNSDNEKIANFMATKTNVYLNYITVLYVFYAMTKLFILQ